MRIHHLNCMTFRLCVRSVTHCLLIEAADCLVLVDAGLGLRDYEQPSLRLRVFLVLNRVPRDPEGTATRQVVGLGFSLEDVRYVVLTHLHLDHSGGLPDFPWAKVHVLGEEHRVATRRRQKSLLHWCGYDAAHWAHGPKWVLYELEGETWFGLPCAPVRGIGSARLVLIPLIAHTRGHCGVAVETDGGWVLHCGDAFVRDVQIDPETPQSPFPTWAGAFERALFPVSARQQLRRLNREHGGEVQLLSARDPIAFARMREAA